MSVDVAQTFFTKLIHNFQPYIKPNNAKGEGGNETDQLAGAISLAAIIMLLGLASGSQAQEDVIIGSIVSGGNRLRHRQLDRICDHGDRAQFSIRF